MVLLVSAVWAVVRQVILTPKRVPLVVLLVMVVQVVRAVMVVQVAWLSLPLLRYPLTT
jgi:hypothetical protein